MAVAHESTTQTLQGSNSTSWAFNMPATRPNGDLYVAVVASDGSNTTIAISGWTEMQAETDEGSVTNQVFWRIGSSEPATYTLTGASEQYVVHVMRFSGGGGTIQSVTGGTGNSTTAVAPTITPTYTGGLVVRSFAVDTDDPSSGALAGHTQRGEASSVSGGGANTVYGAVYTDDTLTTAASSEGTATLPAGSPAYNDNWAAITFIIEPPVPSVTDVETDEDFRDGDPDLTITGTNFEAAKGTGKVEIANNATYASATVIVEQTTTSWGATAIDFTASLSTLTPGTNYLFVLNNSGFRNATGFAITIHRKDAFNMVASPNVADNAATTVQLTAPASGSFVAGKFEEVTAATDAIDITSGNYTEIEWSITATTDATDGAQYEFRVLAGGVPLTTYSQTPKWTVGAGSTTTTIVSSLDEISAALNAYMAAGPNIVSSVDEAQAELNAYMAASPNIVSAVDEIIATLSVNQSYPVTVGAELDEIICSLSVNQSYPVTIVSDLDEISAALNAYEAAGPNIVASADEALADLSVNQSYPVTIVSALDEAEASLNAYMAASPNIVAATDEATADLNVNQSQLTTIVSSVDEMLADLNVLQSYPVTISSSVDEAEAALNAYMAAGPNIVASVDEAQATLSVLQSYLLTIVSTLDEIDASLIAYMAASPNIVSTLDEIDAALAVNQTYLVTIESLLDEVIASLNAEQTGGAGASITIAAETDEAQATLQANVYILTTIEASVDEAQADLNAVQRFLATITSSLDEIEAALNAYMASSPNIVSTLDEATADLNAAQSYPFTIASVVDEAEATLSANQSYPLTIVSSLDEVAAALNAYMNSGPNIVSSVDEAEAALNVNQVYLLTIVSLLDEATADLNGYNYYPFTIVAMLDEVDGSFIMYITPLPGMLTLAALRAINPEYRAYNAGYRGMNPEYRGISIEHSGKHVDYRAR